MRTLFVSILLLITFSCRNNPHVTDMLEKEVYFSESIYNPLLDSIAKIIVYVDSAACGPCNMHIQEWEVKQKELRKWHPETALLFITHPYFAKIESEIKHHSLVIHCDAMNIFPQDNPFLSADPLYQTFLLDRNNRVVLVGSPIGNPKMWDLYKSTIARLVANGGTLTDRETSITRK